MLTRSKTKKLIDINKLPKEALFNLLLQVEPKEIKIVCRSKNPRVREICNSELFKNAYKEKYPKKLIGDKSYVNFKKGFIEIIDEITLNAIIISYDVESKELNCIEFAPYRQVYPSTVATKNRSLKNLNVELIMNNPIQIIIIEDEDGKFRMTVGRDNIYGISTIKDDETFRKNYNQEVKEFLQSIEREKWWNSNIQFRENYATDKAMKEFYDDVINIMKRMNLLEKYYPKLE